MIEWKIIFSIFRTKKMHWNQILSYPRKFIQRDFPEVYNMYNIHTYMKFQKRREWSYRKWRKNYVNLDYFRKQSSLSSFLLTYLQTAKLIGKHPSKNYPKICTKATGNKFDKFGPIFGWLTQSFCEWEQGTWEQ